MGPSSATVPAAKLAIAMQRMRQLVLCASIPTLPLPPSGPKPHAQLLQHPSTKSPSTHRCVHGHRVHMKDWAGLTLEGPRSIKPLRTRMLL